MARSDDAAQIPATIAPLLARRAARLRATPASDDDEQATTQVAEFTIADETYAIVLSTLRAAIPLRLVTPVPLAPPHVLGMVRFEGRLITAMSLASLLGGMPWGADPTTLLVLETDVPGHLVAVDCEQVPKPAALPTAAIEEARARAGDEAIFAMTAPNIQLVHLIDMSRLIAAKRQSTALRSVVPPSAAARFGGSNDAG